MQTNNNKYTVPSLGRNTLPPILSILFLSQSFIK